ncbi:MAG: hypothetical protein JWP70_2135 [Leifsonia sp.]|nr:hypothetical protein [Leifsonia sp.]
MNAIPAGTAQPARPATDRMSPLAMVAVVAGVLLTGAAIGVLGSRSSPIVGVILLVVGLALTIVGAAGLGRNLQPWLPREPGWEDNPSVYPARLEGQLDPTLSRWLWLFKWLLAIPHYIVLVILWVAFLVVTVAAGFVILFTGRYPQPLFQFSVGVLRWSWRVAFYSYGALGSDRYPPFTLARAEYPATFEVLYPERLSHWKVLVKSWLLALPHLFIVAALSGGAASTQTSAGRISLLSLLVFIAAVILLFKGVYRLGIFDFVMGINRWAYRVTVYCALLRDDYPPFRLDQGPVELGAHPADT